MESTELWNALGNSIYVMQGIGALYGAFCVILLVRRIAQKRFFSESAAQQFLDEVRERLKTRDYEGIVDLCDSPSYWSKAVPQLIIVALQNRGIGIAKLRQLLGEKFERDVVADFEYRSSWIATIAKSEPMLGLLGTVMGMISAFGKIAAAQQTGADPSKLAGDISFALFTTAVGLMIAIPLVLAGNMLHVRIGKLQDSVQDHLGTFIDELVAAEAPGGRPAA
jgi:biopolymer transport protein ExbB/TolQ